MEPAVSQIGYGGDVTSREAWDALSERPESVLIDVRTAAEWEFVGLPDLSGLGKETLLVSWQYYPGLGKNENFVAEVRAKGVRPEQAIYLICRSGQRSRHAAMALTSAGYAHCVNVSDGFEGSHDADKHRGRVNGWKIAGLPWVQG
jgi:rhodanese-related sulfurtransferase